MIIREGSIKEFKSLWNYSNTPTYNYFLDNITRNNVEFWTIELSKTLIGELYIFWDSIDKDEANGTNRAYLCAFRIKKRISKPRLWQKADEGCFKQNKG
ncbi:hypothetical protein CI105_08460 [Candidatus Izimaplasma bacterium ZiA1]|uniref:hypothetical protein n=1 Tax=Candidatus Izimoplasma sp. ZiA1 TaxID=2024899 RepID=UPI000BAA3F36|nr:hypothetical protein CI105_08460 [Candidatus Izimaplasma bacterium ZiA1]